MGSIQDSPDPRALRYLEFYSKRLHGISEDQIADKFGFDSPAALYQRLIQYGYPVCSVCGQTPAKPNHCAEKPERRQRRARRGSGEAIELPPAKRAENLFQGAISMMENDLLALDSRREFYRDERFETVRDYPNASTTHYRDNYPPGEASDEKWRELCEKHGRDPSVDHVFVPFAPNATSEGAPQIPPEPLTELIAMYVLAGEPLDPLLEALHPSPTEIEQERLDQAFEDFRHKAGQLATLVRGGRIRRGPSTGDLSRHEQNAARFISSQLRQKVPEAKIRQVLSEHGFSRQEFTRLKNLKIEPPQ